MSRHVPELAGATRSVKANAPRHDEDGSPLISLTDITEIELLMLRRMREMTIGDHRSLAHGSGFDFVGLRDWQAGDRFSTIDWAQSSLTNFSPMVVREFEQPSTATVMVVADTSLSTRCGLNGVPIARAVARAVATIGMSAVFFQDLFGLLTVDGGLQHFGAVRPRIGRNQVMHCLDAYQFGRGVQEITASGTLSQTLGSFMRKTGLVAFVSDFLFPDVEGVIHELSLLSSTHDVFLVQADAAFAFELPPVQAGWIETVDIETGRTQFLRRGELRHLVERIQGWQTRVEALARDADLDLVRVGIDSTTSDLALAEFVGERRLRKVA